MTFFVFFETEDDYGRFRQTFGFTTEAARSEWITAELARLDGRGEYRCGEYLSDLEEWEAPRSEWPHVKILA